MGRQRTNLIAERIFGREDSKDKSRFIAIFDKQLEAIKCDDIIQRSQIISRVYSNVNAALDQGKQYEFVGNSGKINIGKITSVITKTTQMVTESYKEDAIDTSNTNRNGDEVKEQLRVFKKKDIKDYKSEDFLEWQEEIAYVADAFKIDLYELVKKLSEFQRMLLKLGLTEEEFLENIKGNNNYIKEVIAKYPDYEDAVNAYLAKNACDFFHDTVDQENIDDVVAIFDLDVSDENKIKRLKIMFPEMSDEEIEKMIMEGDCLKQLQECSVKRYSEKIESGEIIEYAPMQGSDEEKKDAINQYANMLGINPGTLDKILTGEDYEISCEPQIDLTTSLGKLYDCICNELFETEEEILSKMTEQELQDAKNSLAQHLGFEEITVEMMLESDEILLELENLVLQEQDIMQEQQENTDPKREYAIEDTINGVFASLERENFLPQDIRLALSAYREMITQMPQNMVEQGPESIANYFSSEVQNYELTGNSSAIFQMLSTLNYSGNIQEILQIRREELISALDSVEMKKDEKSPLLAGKKINDEEADFAFAQYAEEIVFNAREENGSSKEDKDVLITSVTVIPIDAVLDLAQRTNIRDGQIKDSIGFLQGVLVGKERVIPEIDK